MSTALRAESCSGLGLTKNIDFYADYVRWDVYHNAQAAATNSHRQIENGVSLVINWRY